MEYLNAEDFIGQAFFWVSVVGIVAYAWLVKRKGGK